MFPPAIPSQLGLKVFVTTPPPFIRRSLHVLRSGTQGQRPPDRLRQRPPPFTPVDIHARPGVTH